MENVSEKESLFALDVFISYTHIDNQPEERREGWVTVLHTRLEKRLAKLLDEKPSLWRDDRLKGNAVFAEVILQQLNNVAVLVSVLSPRYTQSMWCDRELQAFVKAAERKYGLNVGNYTRLFKVVMIPIEEEHPPPLNRLLGYKFWRTDPKTDRPLEFDPEDERLSYYSILNSLAYDIRDQLKRLTGDNDSGATIYLAECGQDRQADRDSLQGELRRNGYTVLPDERLSDWEEEYIAEVDHLLDQCDLSVHLVGAAPGSVPDGPTRKSNVILQNERAVKKSKAGGLKRVISLPEGTSSEDPEQQAFIESIHTDADVQYEAELIAGNLEALKSAVYVELNRLKKPVVYLAECGYDRRKDREKIKGQLREYTVLPDRPLPKLEKDYTAEVDRLLDQCALSVHLVGTAAGFVPDGPTRKSNVILQNERAVEKSKAGKLQRVIWLPEGTSSEDPEQQAFIESIHTDDEVHYGAELIVGSIEDLRSAVLATLKKIEEPGKPVADGGVSLVS